MRYEIANLRAEIIFDISVLLRNGTRAVSALHSAQQPSPHCSLLHSTQP